MLPRLCLPSACSPPYHRPSSRSWTTSVAPSLYASSSTRDVRITHSNVGLVTSTTCLLTSPRDFGCPLSPALATHKNNATHELSVPPTKLETHNSCEPALHTKVLYVMNFSSVLASAADLIAICLRKEPIH